MHRLISGWLVVRSVGVADERGEAGRVRGQDAHVTEDHEQAQPEEERVSRRPALAAHGRQGYMPSFVVSTTPCRSGATLARKLFSTSAGSKRSSGLSMTLMNLTVPVLSMMKYARLA